MDEKKIKQLVDQQANDVCLWLPYQGLPLQYLQRELRRLHAVIEGKTGDERARELIGKFMGDDACASRS